MATRAALVVGGGVFLALTSGCGFLDVAGSESPGNGATVPTVDEVRAEAPRDLQQVAHELAAHGVTWRSVSASGNYWSCSGYEADAPSDPAWTYQATASLGETSMPARPGELLGSLRPAFADDGWRLGADRPGEVDDGIEVVGSRGVVHLWARKDHRRLRITVLPVKSTVSIAVSGPRPCQEMTADEAAKYEERELHGRDPIDIETPSSPPRPPR